jgi:divalent metal cation (Fe/Co/Zn/Cd) transporter
MIDEARKQSAAVATDSTQGDTAALTKDSATAAAKSTKASPVVFVVAIILGLGFLYALPFLAGLQNILGLLIIGIALYEAWKLNVRAELSVSGPHRVSPSSAPA